MSSYHLAVWAVFMLGTDLDPRSMLLLTAFGGALHGPGGCFIKNAGSGASLGDFGLICAHLTAVGLPSGQTHQ
eukprot:1990381-Karenia_brevis.AAC.1